MPKKKKTWKQMNASERRVSVALDVIAQLKKKTMCRFVPTNGNLVCSPEEMGDFFGEIFTSKKWKEKLQKEGIFSERIVVKPTDQVRDVLPDKCQVCALGAMFVCAVDRLDKLAIKDLEGSRTPGFNRVASGFVEKDVMRYLGDIFEEKQLRLIEISFEKGEGMFHHIDPYVADGDGELLERALIFKKNLKDPKKRMLAIMENIVKNDGTFVP